MRKQDILKMHGLTEAEFYKLYPTEEHYKMAMGGSSFTQFAQNGATTKNPFIAPPGAKRVDKPDPGYNPIPGQDPTAAKQYYEKMLADKDPGGPGMKKVDTPEGKKKYKEWLIEQVKNGVSPQQLIDKKKTTPDMLPELMDWYNPQYTEKTPVPPPPPKQMDLGIGWSGEKTEVFGHSMPTFKDSNGKEYNLQQFKVPARWNDKDKSWDTNSGWNDPTVLSGYQKDGKFVPFDPSASKLASEGEGAKSKSYYTQEGLKYPSYMQSGEDQKVMKTGPLRISGNTAMDVQNTGMNYNEAKDTVAPINTQGTGMGIGQDKLILDVQKKNLPAATGLGNALPQGKQGGPLFNPYIPDFFNPQFIMQDGGDPSIPTLSPKDSLNMFRDVIKKMGGPSYPGQTQDSVIESKKNDFLHYIRNNTMDAIAREENAALYQNPGMMQLGGNMQDYRTDPFQNKFNPYTQNQNLYGFNPNMNNQNAYLKAANQGKEQFQQDMGSFMGATQNMAQNITPYTQTSVTQMQEGGNPTPWWQRQGMQYFPMNYDPIMKMSDKDIEAMQMLAANPTTNLKEFHAKKRLFGPGVRRVDMVFGSKPKLQTMNDLKEFVPQETIKEDIHVIRDPKKEMNLGPQINTTPNPNFNWSTNFQMGGWNFAGSEQTPDYRSMAFGNQPQPIMMQDNGAPPVSGDPLTNYGPEQQYKITQKFKNKWDPEAAVNWGLAGTNMISSMLEQNQARKNEERWKSMQGADNQFYAQPAGNRGDYDQFGNIRPNQKVPVQFAGQNFGQMGSPYQFQEGGEYYMSDDEINAIMQAGGEIDFLD